MSDAGPGPAAAAALDAAAITAARLADAETKAERWKAICIEQKTQVAEARAELAEMKNFMGQMQQEFTNQLDALKNIVVQRAAAGPQPSAEQPPAAADAPSAPR